MSCRPVRDRQRRRSPGRPSAPPSSRSGSRCRPDCPGSRPMRFISAAIQSAAFSPAGVPGPRPSYLSSASSLMRAPMSAAVISGEVVRVEVTASAAGAAGSAGSLGPHPAQSEAHQRGRPRPSVAGNFIRVSLQRCGAHYRAQVAGSKGRSGSALAFPAPGASRRDRPGCGPCPAAADRRAGGSRRLAGRLGEPCAVEAARDRRAPVAAAFASRSFDEATKFQSRKRGPSSGSPPANMMRVPAFSFTWQGRCGDRIAIVASPTTLSADLRRALDHIEAKLRRLGSFDRRVAFGGQHELADAARKCHRRAMAIGRARDQHARLRRQHRCAAARRRDSAGRWAPAPHATCGSATQVWIASIRCPASRSACGVRSECAMPRPAVIQFTAPGRIV